MVATVTILGMAGAIAAEKLASNLPQWSKDPRTETLAKLALAAALILASMWVKNPHLKVAMLAASVGVTAYAVAPYVPFLQR